MLSNSARPCQRLNSPPPAAKASPAPRVRLASLRQRPDGLVSASSIWYSYGPCLAGGLPEQLGAFPRPREFSTVVEKDVEKPGSSGQSRLRRPRFPGSSVGESPGNAVSWGSRRRRPLRGPAPWRFPGAKAPGFPPRLTPARGKRLCWEPFDRLGGREAQVARE